MGVLTLYVTYVEKGVFVVVIQRDSTGFDPDVIWEASSNLEKWVKLLNQVWSLLWQTRNYNYYQFEWHLLKILYVSVTINFPSIQDLIFVPLSILRYKDKYNLTLVARNKKDRSRRESSFEKSVALFFDENGTLVLENVEKEVLKLHASLSSNKKNK